MNLWWDGYTTVYTTHYENWQALKSIQLFEMLLQSSEPAWEAQLGCKSNNVDWETRDSLTDWLHWTAQCKFVTWHKFGAWLAWITLPSLSPNTLSTFFSNV